MKSKILILAILMQGMLHAQSFQWAKTFGGSSSENATDFHLGNNGNLFFTGAFSGSPAFDSITLVSAGAEDAFIAKADNQGNILWVRSVGNSSSDWSYTVAEDAQENILIAGIFAGTIDLDPGPGIANHSAVGSFDAFILKLDKNGQYRWSHSFGGSSLDAILSVAVDANGNVYSAGFFNSIVDFDPSSGVFSRSSSGSEDAFIHKMDSAGNFLWVKTFGSFFLDRVSSLRLDAAANVYASGYFQGSVDFDPGSSQAIINAVNGGRDGYVLKLDSAGNYAWVKTVGGTGLDAIDKITLDPQGNIYAAGRFSDTIDLDPNAGVLNLAPRGITDAFLIKLDLSGSLVWAHSPGSSNFCHPTAICVNPAGEAYLGGVFRDTLYLKNGLNSDSIISSGGEEGFIQKLDAFGNLEWTKSIGSGFSDRITGLQIDQQGKLFGLALYMNTVDFDPGNDTANLSAIGGQDIALFQWQDCQPIYTADSVESCGAFTWINGITYASGDTNATFTLAAANGCDSIIRLHLRVDSISDVSLSLNGNTLVANNSNATYQWLDCNANFSPIAGATSQSFNPSQNGSYAVVLTEGRCTDTSACVIINTLSAGSALDFNEVQIAPNPSSDWLQISSPSDWPELDFSIHNISGELICQGDFKSLPEGKIFWQVPPGLYLLKLQSPNGTKTFKVIKE